MFEVNKAVHEPNETSFDLWLVSARGSKLARLGNETREKKKLGSSRLSL